MGCVGTHRFRLDVHLHCPAAPLPDAAGPLSDIELELRPVHVALNRSPEEVGELLPRHRWKTIKSPKRAVLSCRISRNTESATRNTGCGGYKDTRRASRSTWSVCITKEPCGDEIP